MKYRMRKSMVFDPDVVVDAGDLRGAKVVGIPVKVFNLLFRPTGKMCGLVIYGVGCDCPATVMVSRRPNPEECQISLEIPCCQGHADLWRHQIEHNGGVACVEPLEERGDE